MPTMLSRLGTSVSLGLVCFAGFACGDPAQAPAIGEDIHPGSGDDNDSGDGDQSADDDGGDGDGDGTKPRGDAGAGAPDASDQDSGEDSDEVSASGSDDIFGKSIARADSWWVKGSHVYHGSKEVR